MGSALFFVVVTLFIFLFFKNRLIGISLGINIFLVSILNLLLKNIFLIPRPDTLRLILESGYSYPSGHTMSSFAFYGYLIYLIYKMMRPSIWKKILIILLILLILLIGFSRVYLGVHHFSDILGGYLISFAYLILFIKLSNKLGMENFYEVQKRIPKNKGRNEKKEIHLLDGLLYCGDCGHRISIQSRRKKDNRCYCYS